MSFFYVKAYDIQKFNNLGFEMRGKKTLGALLVTVAGIVVTTLIDPLLLLYALFIGFGLFFLWIIFLFVQTILENRKAENLKKILENSKQAQFSQEQESSLTEINPPANYEAFPESVEDLRELLES